MTKRKKNFKKIITTSQYVSIMSPKYLNSRKRQFELFVMLTMRHTINLLLYQQGILSLGKIITYSKLTLMHARAYNFNLSQIYSKLTNKEI